jgi:quinol-cytochrome oxidoreductase complex cytochrome b subunit
MIKNHDSQQVMIALAAMIITGQNNFHEKSDNQPTKIQACKKMARTAVLGQASAVVMVFGLISAVLLRNEPMFITSITLPPANGLPEQEREIIKLSE